MLQLPPFLYLVQHAALYGGAAIGAADLDIDFTTGGSLDSRITFARASVGTYYNSSGVLTTASSGNPRFDYDPVTLAAKGLLVEIQQLNSAQQTEDFSNAFWTKTGVSVTANQIAAPDGNTTADLLTASATTATVSVASGVATGTAYVQSFYAKKGTSDWCYIAGVITVTGAESPKAYFNLNTGALGTVGTNITNSTIQNVGNGWYRISASRLGTAGVEHIMFGICDADNNPAVTVGRTCYLWGAQFEVATPLLTVPTSYVPGNSVTRIADVATMTGTDFSSWFNASAGTFVVDFDIFAPVGTRGVISADNNSVNEQIKLHCVATDPMATIRDGNVTQADLDAGTVAANTIHKFGISFSVNDIAACLDGGTVVTDVVATMPTPTQLRIGYDGAGSTSNYLCGHLRRLRFWNTARSDAELQTLTT